MFMNHGYRAGVGAGCAAAVALFCLGLPPALSAQPQASVPSLQTAPGTPPITRPWPSASAGIGQTVELEGLRITPLKVIRDQRMGCVTPPGELPQRLCTVHGWLDLSLRIERSGRSRTVTLREMTALKLRGGTRLGFVARPAQTPADPAEYSFEFIVWPQSADGPFR